MAFQCHGICIKTSHTWFPRTCCGSFPAIPVDQPRVDPLQWVAGVCSSPSCLGGSGVFTESHSSSLSAPCPPSPAWVSEFRWCWATPPASSWGSNSFFCTKKTLREEQDLASEKCWGLDLPHSSEGWPGLQDGKRSQGSRGRRGLGGTAAGRSWIWRCRAPCGPGWLTRFSLTSQPYGSSTPSSPTWLPEWLSWNLERNTALSDDKLLPALQDDKLSWNLIPIRFLTSISLPP